MTKAMRICMTEGCLRPAVKPWEYPERCLPCDNAISVKKMQELAAIQNGLLHEGSIKDVA